MKTKKPLHRMPAGASPDALLERVRALENTIEHMDQGVSIVDAGLRVVRGNRRFRELLDLPEALCRPGTPMETVFRYNAARGDYGPGDVEEQVRARMDLARKFQAHRFERERPDGTVLEIRGMPIPGGGFVSLYTDVTQRVRSERALRESESRKGAILDASLDAILTMDHEGRIVEFNPAAERCFGYTRGQAIGAKMAELIVPPELRERHREGLRRYLATRQGKILGKRLELPALRADGSRFEAELTISLIPGSSPPAFTGTVRDITERTAAAKALRESEERFRSLTVLSADWYWEQDEQFRFTLFSGAGAAAMSRDGDSSVYLGIARWESPDLDLMEGDWSQHRAQLERHEPFRDLLMRRRMNDGTAGYMSVSGEPVLDQDGRFKGYRGVAKNVTARVEAEQQLRERQIQLSLIADAVPAMIAYYDRDVRLRYANRQHVEFYGYALADRLGKHMREAIGEEAWTEVQPYFKRADAGETLSYERTVRRPRREPAHIDVHFVPHRAESGSILGHYVLVTDITERAVAAKALRESEERFRALTGLSSDWYWEQDTELRMSYLSDRAEERLGVSPARVLGRRRWDFDNVLPVSGSWDEHRRQLEAREPFREFEYLRRLEDGSRRYASLSGEPLFGEAGEFRGYRGIGRDVTAARLRETELLRFRAALNLSSDGIYLVDCDSLAILDCNAGACRVLGYSREELVGSGVERIFADRTPEQLRAEYASLVSSDTGAATLETLHRRKDGTAFPVEINRWIHRTADGPILVGVAHDISERKRAEARLNQLAHYDVLTGLPNRALIHDRLRQAMARAERGQTLLAVMFLDLDRFKEINDSLGHAAGDEVLKEAARRLQSCLRSTDSVGRLGGDEFTVLLEDVHHVDEITVVAGKILAAFGEPAEVAGHELRLSTSIGVTVFPLDDQDADTLLKNADMAMYQAKQEGRNNFQFFAAEMGARTERRADLRLRLHRALERGEFALHYQPQVDLAGGGIFGAEALLRWHDAELGPISPAQFIPVAEETGLIVPIGDWVLREACRQCKSWLDAGLGPLRVAVNLSPRQFRQKKLAQRIGEILHETGLPAACLEIEITEGIVMKHAERAIKTLTELNRLGVQIAIDDFGTGYSSLAYLQRFPVHVLKIDQSFVQAIRGEADEAAIVNTVIQLAKLLGLKSLAEGVETAEQRNYLHAHGCDSFQGYLFCRPQAAAQIGETLAAHRRDRAPA